MLVGEGHPRAPVVARRGDRRMQRDGVVLAPGANHHALAGKRRLEWIQQWINGPELAETNTFDGTGQDVWEGDEAACALLRAD